MAGAANRVAGVAYCYVDGVKVDLGGKITVSPWTTEKESVKGLSGTVGYKETPVTPFIEIEVITSPDLDLSAFQSVRSSTVIAELANGQTWTLRNAWSTSKPDMDGAEGTATLRFEGRDIELTT
jgi:hypothetical protein